MSNMSTKSFLTKFTTIFIILYGIYYMPIDSHATAAPIKNTLMVTSILLFFGYSFKLSKALVLGCLFLLFQITTASFYAESWRWSTILYSALLTFTYISIYNFITIERVFTIEHFIRICKWMMMAYFVVCIIQQILIILDITYLPLVNMMNPLGRGIGCQSLSVEPSTFARFMLVFYYAYVKCCEYKRGEGAFTLSELFSGEHRWVTIRFLWMMFTMGSGTAFVCLILFSLYFVRRHNWYYVIPILTICYLLIQASGIEHLDRATGVMNEVAQLDQAGAQEVDGSGAARVSPLLNSFKADLTKFETWFGHGIDYSRNNNLIIRQTATLFDDYGLIWYILSLIFAFSCAYNFWSLASIFMLAGIGGGCNGNIQYAWELMMVMTCVKYFYENRCNPEIYEEEEEEELDIENDEEESKTAAK